MTLKLEGEDANKLQKKNKCPLPVSKGVADAFAKNILEKTPIRFHDGSFDTLTINYKSN